jgi:hypothetical protein
MSNNKNASNSTYNVPIVGMHECESIQCVIYQRSPLEDCFGRTQTAVFFDPAVCLACRGSLEFAKCTSNLLVELPVPFPSFSAEINPARDMGPRLVTLFGHWGSDSMTDWLPFFIGPLIGGPSGAFLADKVLL